MLKLTEENSEGEHNDRIGIKVSNRMLRRMQKHISAVNYDKNLDLTQQDWIGKAIEEKLSKELENPLKDVNSIKQISIRIERDLRNQLDQVLENLKSHGRQYRGYSKKSWILDAIEEKLEREENN